VRGTDTGDCPKTVSNTAFASCLVQTTPAIAITKNCLDAQPQQLGSVIHVGGNVSNTGDVDLQNVFVTNTVTSGLVGVSAGVHAIISIGTLSVGQSKPWSDSYTPTANGCVLDTAIASANGVCAANTCTPNTHVINSASASCCVTSCIPSNHHKIDRLRRL